ncbi:MAG: flagellar hook-basal body complex protein [Pseudomonadota bacterium]|nr:flagellar hook-basal body complex protein [Pseudomonadota bacterium]
MASLFSALTVAVGGLTAQSDALGNISDNLSNAQTTGFKSIGTRFESLVTLSNAASNDPGGVRATPSYQNDVQGNLVQSQTATSLAITGQGFFAVEPATQNADGTTNFAGNIVYTRQGDFTLDKNGYIVNGSGYYLNGYNVSSAGVVNTSTTTPIQVSALLNRPVASTQASYVGNLPSSVATGFTSTPSTVLMYDALGNTHDMTYTWSKVTAGQWNLAVDVAGGGGTQSTDYAATVPFTFNSSTNIGTIASIGTGTGYTVPNNSNTTENKAQVQFNLNFAGFGAGTQAITLNFGDYNSPNGLTQFSGTNVSVSSFSQDGLPQGSFTNLSIDQNGFVSLNYNNGSLKTIAQIPIVQFFAQDQLQRGSGGVYSATLASGTPRYSSPGASGAGTIVSNSLESSNVDIATQFTNLIQAQQIYSANAKTITTVNNMLDTIVKTIR